MSKWSAVRGLFAGAAVLLAAMLPAAWAAGETLAQVVAVTGQAQAERPGEAPRSLACDDVLRENETLATSPGAGVGLLAGDLYLQLTAAGRLRLASEAGALSLQLGSGALRLVDTRPAGAEGWRLVSVEGEVRGQAGSDAELFASPGTLRVCAHAGSVAVAPASGIPVEIGAGSCARIAAGALTRFEGAAPEIAVADSRICAFDVAGLSDLFTPTDVASPLVLPGFPGVGAADAFRRDACDTPGSGCGGLPTSAPVPPPSTPPPGPPIFVDPDPDTGCGGPGFPCPPNGVF